MKKVLLSLLSIVIVIAVSAQVPQAFKYQTVVRSISDEILKNQAVYFRISILQGSSMGPEVYKETFSLSTNDFGLAAFNIGQGAVESGNFSTISWSSYDFWVKVELDPDAGGSAVYEEVGTSQLLSVPYALAAKSAANTYWVKNVNDISYSSGKVGIGTTSPTGYLEVTDHGLGDPHNLIILGQTETSNRLRLSSGTNYAIISVGSTMVENQGLVIRHSSGNVGINETNPDSKLHVNGDAHVTGNVTMDSKVTIPTAPIDNTDAANKAYVDKLLEKIDELNQRLIDSKVGLILWNKLGSDAEVQNSEVGPDGTIVGSSYAYEAAKYGNGYVRKATSSNYVSFPQTILQNLKSRGTVELWVNPKVTNPVAYSYGVFPLVGNTFGTNSHVYIAWGDGESGVGFYGSVNFDGTGHQTEPYESQYVATIGVPFHVAICWNVDGIDGTSNTVRVYRNGTLINTSDATWDANDTTHNYDGFTLGMGPDGEGFDKYIVDNIKVWNYAKTDFSDRFKE